MEKVNDILKSLIGLLLLMSVIFAFSCEKKSETATTEENSTYKENESHNSSSEEWKQKMKKESQDLDQQLDALKEKAKNSGGKAEVEINKAIEKIKTEREELVKDSTNEKFKYKWDSFKTKVKNSVDSLNKKI